MKEIATPRKISAKITVTIIFIDNCKPLLFFIMDIFEKFNGPNIRFIENTGSLSDVHEKVLAEVRDLFDFDVK